MLMSYCLGHLCKQHFDCNVNSFWFSYVSRVRTRGQKLSICLNVMIDKVTCLSPMFVSFSFDLIIEVISFAVDNHIAKVT